MEITWRDKTITCEEGTTLFDISKQVNMSFRSLSQKWMV